MEIVEQELISAIRETVQHHIFETAEEVEKILSEKFNIPRKDIVYEMVNGRNELTVKVPGGMDKVDLKITILGGEVVVE